MNDDAFLQAILADPDDDHLRLVYADWLEERGDPLGEFIRVQTALVAPHLDRTQRAELQKREHELWAAHHKAWLGPVEPLIMRGKFRRGFLEHVEMAARQFVAHADVLFAAAPVRAVTLWDAAVSMADLAECPALRRLRHLGFSPENHVFLPESNVFTVPAIHQLANSPHLAELRSLRFQGNDLTISEVRELTASPVFGNLEKLALDGNDLVGDLGLSAVIASPRFRQLQRLSVSGCGLSATGVGVLARAPFLGQLTSLRLDHNQIGNEGVRALALSRHLGNLRTLRLKDTGVNSLGVVALVRCKGLANLETLDLSDNPISDRAAELAQSPHLTNLRDLNLRGTHISSTALARLRQHFGERIQI